MSDPEFGPRGYLPGRAAKRARKIVLREQMGLGWPLAAVGASLALVVVAVVFFALRSGPPGPPFTAVGSVADFGRETVAVLGTDSGPPALVVRTGGALRAFAGPGEEVRWCEASRRLESEAGTVWTLEGVRVSGEPGVAGGSLAALPTAVHDGKLYVASTAPEAPLPAAPNGAVPRCAPPTASGNAACERLVHS